MIGKNKDSNKKIGTVAVLLAFVLVGVANASYPSDMGGSYDQDEWSLVADGSGGILFPSDDGWDMSYMFGDSVSPAWPNARIMTENATGGLAVVYARGDSVGEDTYTKICLSVSGDAGMTWAESDIMDGSANLFHGMPTMDIDSSGFLHVAWVEYNVTSDSSKILYKNNTDGDWSAAPAHLDQPGWNQTRPALQLDGNDVAHVVWQSIHMTFHTNTIWGWNSTSSNDTITALVGQTSPMEEGADDDYQYPGIAIDASNGIFVSYHEVDAGTGAYAVGVSAFDNAFGYVASNKTISLKPQSRNPSIALNESGHVLLAYKAYATGTPGVSSIQLTTQDTGDNLNDWTTVEMVEYAYHGVWLYPSVACSSTDQYMVTSLVSREESYSITGGMFWGNVSGGVLNASGTIEHSHDYVVYAFSNLKFSSHNNNGQDYGDNVLWVIEYDGEDYLDTDIVLMGDQILGSYTHPVEPTTTTPPTTAEKVGNLAVTLGRLLPVVIVLGLVAVFLGMFLTKEGGDVQ